VVVGLAPRPAGLLRHGSAQLETLASPWQASRRGTGDWQHGRSCSALRFRLPQSRGIGCGSQWHGRRIRSAGLNAVWCRTR